MAYSREEAILRVALLVARADGRVGPEETKAAVQALPGSFQDMSERQLLDLMRAAERDIAETPEDEVMDRIAAGLPEHANRLLALKVGCLVASADQLLSWRETSSLSRVAERLGLSRHEVKKVVRAAL